MTDVPVDNAALARSAVPEGLTLAEEEELRAELAKVPCAAALGLCWKEQTRAAAAGRGGLCCFSFRGGVTFGSLS